MSLLQKTDTARPARTVVLPSRNRAAERDADRTVFLVVVCAVLVLLIAGVLFAPVSVGSGVREGLTFVGP